ncbi:hypothetical protein [Miltoncostaea marina]|uniref:hypothetical protein n=1 Tax=Miltoncostaea marina TaxID=2843215 RepID=UPI001C3C6C6A|nr:hypothetical protein [Miltoncostaea marina]
MPTAPTATLRAACAAAIAIGLVATAPVALARQGADDPPGSDDTPARAGGGAPDDSARRGGDDAGRRGDRTDVRVRGVCSATSTATLKLSPENGPIEVDFEVDQNRDGRRWGVVIRRNAARVLARAATTAAPSGSFEMRTVVAPGSPRTRVTAVARARRGGEVCRAAAVI